jgi:hypothetical protein
MRTWLRDLLYLATGMMFFAGILASEPNPQGAREELIVYAMVVPFTLLLILWNSGRKARP